MSWADISKKNIEKVILKEILPSKKEEVELIMDPNILDYKEEFELQYMSSILSLKQEFKEYLEEEALPLMNSPDSSRHSYFYDFIQNHSTNFIKLKQNIEEKNNEYRRLIEEELNESLFTTENTE